jgi:hypothetical protein
MASLKAAAARVLALLRITRHWRLLVAKNIYIINEVVAHDLEVALAKEQGVPLAHSTEWQRFMSFLVADADGTVFRVSMLHFKWRWRCMQCRQNNKSLMVCVFNKPPAKLERHYRETLSVFFNYWATHHRDDYPEEFAAERVKTFHLHDLEIRTPISANRVPTQHMVPVVDVLLLAAPFSRYVPCEVFFAPLCEKMCVEVNVKNMKNKFHLQEPLEMYERRVEACGRLRRRVEVEGDFSFLARRDLNEFISEVKREWKLIPCNPRCCKIECRLCKACTNAPGRWFCDALCESLVGFLRREFNARSGPFAGVPRGALECFADDAVRIERPTMQCDIKGPNFKRVKSVVMQF